MSLVIHCCGSVPTRAFLLGGDMVWVKIDDHFDEHPKMAQVGPLGWGYWLAGLAYCNRNLTDGFIPWNKAKHLGSFEIIEDDGKQWNLSRSCGMMGDDVDAEWVIGILVDAGLWEVVENGSGRIDGFMVHDYPEYQPTKERSEELRQVRADAGRKGGLAKAKQNASKPSSKSSSKKEAKVYPVPVPVPVPEPETEPEEEKPIAPKPARTREPDQLFNAIAEAWKGRPYHAELLTTAQAALVGKATAELRAIGAAPEQVPREWEALRERFDNPTPAALAKHWRTNGTGPKRDTTTNPITEAESLLAGWGEPDRPGRGYRSIDE